MGVYWPSKHTGARLSVRDTSHGILVAPNMPRGGTCDRHESLLLPHCISSGRGVDPNVFAIWGGAEARAVGEGNAPLTFFRNAAKFSVAVVVCVDDTI